MENTIEGLAKVRSSRSVDQTMAKITAILAEKGITVFAVVDHSGEAAKVGLAMHPTKLLIFGSPKAGTPLMIAAPSIAIDLPLKLLVWEDDHSDVWIAYNTAEYLRERHRLPEELAAALAAVDGLAQKAAE